MPNERSESRKCKKPKPLYLTADETAPDTLNAGTDLTSLTTDVVRRFQRQIIINLRDRCDNIRGVIEQVRNTSIYTAQPNRIYNLITIEATLFIKGREEKYSLVFNEDENFPIPQVITNLGLFKLTSIQGKATYSKVNIAFQGIGNAQKLFLTFL